MDTLNIFAPDWSRVESYGRIANEMADGLVELGHHINRIGGYAPGGLFQVAFGGLLLGYPTNFRKFGPLAQRGPRIALTMFESTALPDGWAEALNACDAVVVPSSWLVQVFHRAGVQTPMYVVPLGISSAFTYKRRARHNRPFRFLVIADRGARKNWMNAAFAFYRAFQESPAVELILKSRPGSNENLMGFTNANVHYIAEEYDDAQMAQLYQQCDVMVFPARGEGFGWPPREFAATGGIALATNWGGTAEDVEHWGIPINTYRMVPAWQGDEKFYGLGQWADPDIDHLAAQMVTLYEQRHTLDERGLLFSRWVNTHYRWENTIGAVSLIWERVKEAHHARESV